MGPGDQYRIKAAELFALAKAQEGEQMRANFEALARSYLLLAEQAERNSLTDIVYEAVPSSKDKEA